MKTIHGAELAAKEEKKKLSANANMAEVGLHMALQDHGVLPTPEMLADMRHDGCVELPNTGQKVVTIRQWREAAIKEGLGKGCSSDDARNRAWKRARAELKAAGKAMQSAPKKEAWCWVMEKRADFRVIDGGKAEVQAEPEAGFLD